MGSSNRGHCCRHWSLVNNACTCRSNRVALVVDTMETKRRERERKRGAGEWVALIRAMLLSTKCWTISVLDTHWRWPAFTYQFTPESVAKCEQQCRPPSSASLSSSRISGRMAAAASRRRCRPGKISKTAERRQLSATMSGFGPAFPQSSPHSPVALFFSTTLSLVFLSISSSCRLSLLRTSVW